MIQTEQHVTPAPVITSQHVLDTFIGTNGVVPLTLERLNRIHDTNCEAGSACEIHERITEANLITLIAPQLSKLQDMIRAKTIMDTYFATQLAIAAAVSNMSLLDPFEASKTATNFIQKLAELTDRRTHETNINLNELIYNELPDQESREAWVYLTKSQDKIIQGN